jgi:hypothetical protein
MIRRGPIVVGAGTAVWIQVGSLVVELTAGDALRHAATLDLDLELGKTTLSVRGQSWHWRGSRSAARRMTEALRHAAMPEAGST